MATRSRPAARPEPEITSIPTCATCRYWITQQCWRFPPIPMLGGGFVRPSVKSIEWCGEHDPSP